MGNKRIPLEPDKTYHVYNHGNAKDNIFRCDDNYTYFLKKYIEYIYPIADTFAYCLMPNHFHLLLRIKSEKDLIELLPNPQGFKNLAGLNNLAGIISQRFSNFFNAYAKAFNKMYERKGSLFLDNFERKLVTDDEYFRNLVHYIHYNPVHHGFVSDFRDWKYSSFESYFSQSKSRINRKEVIDLFDNITNFKAYHHRAIDDNFIVEFD